MKRAHRSPPELRKKSAHPRNSRRPQWIFFISAIVVYADAMLSESEIYVIYEYQQFDEQRAVHLNFFFTHDLQAGREN